MIVTLAVPVRFAAPRRAARATVIDRYDLRRVRLPAWLNPIDRVSAMRWVSRAGKGTANARCSAAANWSLGGPRLAINSITR